MTFWLNPDIDLTKIRDSMQLDSNTDIARLDMDGYTATLEVRGDVRVWFDGVYYDAPSVFPEELKSLIATDADWFDNPRVEVSSNNWFEAFWGFSKYPYEHYDVVECEGMDCHGVLDLLIGCIMEELNED